DEILHCFQNDKNEKSLGVQQWHSRKMTWLQEEDTNLK
ncbi:MAG: hypothetical protein QOH93_2665, partial [Chloroflexia bacterium]|nr:hypothetical protein [Chloroflexia bacterium]